MAKRKKNSSEHLVGTNGDDVIDGHDGKDLIEGRGGNDRLFGGKHDDRIYGGDGDDRLYGEKGNDYLDGGAGRDFLDGGEGDDVLHYDYVGASGFDVYEGGKGTDTLSLAFTQADWDALNGEDNFLLQEMRDFTAYAEAGTTSYLRFESFNLIVRNFEELRVTVDGEVISIDDQPVTALADTVTVDEDAGATVIDVLENDQAPDGVDAVELVEGPAQGAVVLEGNAFTFDPGEDFQHLAEGESETVTFTYEVSDVDGDTDTAEVAVTVEGANDAPVGEDVTVRIVENESNVRPLAVEDEARTVVNAGGFYVLDMTTGDLTFTTRGADALTPDAVAPTDGVVVYLNPNTDNWFVEAHVYSEGVGTAIDPAALEITGYEGRTLLRDASFYFLEDTSDVAITVDLPAFRTPDGEVDGTLTLTGLDYVANATKTVDVGTLALSIEPVGTEAPVEIDPAVTDAEGDDITFELDTEGTLGDVTLTADGTFLYDQGNAFGALAEGDIGFDTFTYTASDGNGGSTTHTVTVEVEGTNDAPDAAPLTAEVYAENGNVDGFDAGVPAQTILNAGMFFVLDYDAGTIERIERNPDRLTVADVAPQNGIALLINPNSNSTYVDAAYFEMGVATVIDPTTLLPTGFDGEFQVHGERLFLLDAVADGTISVVVEDLATEDGIARVELSVEGIDYAGPFMGDTVQVAGAAGSLSEAEIDLSVLIEAEVYDPDDTVFTFSLDTSATQGSVVDNGDGTFTYSADGAFDALMAGETATDTFTYTVFDAAGASDTETVTVTTIGTLDDTLLA